MQTVKELLRHIGLYLIHDRTWLVTLMCWPDKLQARSFLGTMRFATSKHGIIIFHPAPSSIVVQAGGQVNMKDCAGVQ